MDEMTIADYIALGRRLGYVSECFCLEHDGAPMTEEEHALALEGDEMCMFCVRLYPAGDAADYDTHE